MSRTKGALNKSTTEVKALIDRSKLGPAQALLAVLNRDFKKLKLPSADVTKWLPSGIEYTEPAIKIEHQIEAAKILMKYRYSQMQSVELSGEVKGIEIVVRDYTKT